MKPLLRHFFRLLYHQLAFTYDLVAAAVSFNRWKEWVTSVLPFIEGPHVLEIGHGPGHLQHLLLSGGLTPVGLDESPQMGRLALRNLRERASRISPHPPAAPLGYAQSSLARGVAQALPFPDGCFDTVVATFPTEYITDPRTLSEIRRCLAPEGRLVVLPVALPKNRLLDWLFRATHQRPAEALEIIQARLKEPFAGAGFEVEVRTLEAGSDTLLVILAARPCMDGGAILSASPT